jgi:hypothetical protein
MIQIWGTGENGEVMRLYDITMGEIRIKSARLRRIDFKVDKVVVYLQRCNNYILKSNLRKRRRKKSRRKKKNGFKSEVGQGNGA